MIEERRRWDCFLNLHHDDVLWANMIRAQQDLLALDRKVMTDDVLYDLLKMGILDWNTPNNWMNQTTPAMRHVTVMQMRMLAQHLSLTGGEGWFTESVNCKQIASKWKKNQPNYLPGNR